MGEVTWVAWECVHVSLHYPYLSFVYHKLGCCILRSRGLLCRRLFRILSGWGC